MEQHPILANQTEVKIFLANEASSEELESEINNWLKKRNDYIFDILYQHCIPGTMDTGEPGQGVLSVMVVCGSPYRY